MSSIAEEMMARSEKKNDPGRGRELPLPDDDSLIEAIMHPYPTSGLRAATCRAALKLQG